MPTRLLSIPHRPQEHETGCLAAYALMLAWGEHDYMFGLVVATQA